MDLVRTIHPAMKWCFCSAIFPISQQRVMNYGGNCNYMHRHVFCFPFSSYRFPCLLRKSHVSTAKKKSSESEPILKPSIVEEVSAKDDDEEDGLYFDDLDDDGLDEDDDYLDDEYIEEEARVGDGSGGGGVSLAGTWWDKTALAIAEEVALSFDGELGIYAFRTLLNSIIQIRIERLTNKSGSPSMLDIEDFTSAYRERLDEAEVAGSIPDNITLEVSSPGVERVVRVPEDLERFKERPMFVKYVSGVTESGSTSEHDGIFRLISYDLETKSCTWGIADVRVNREKAGKGRPLSKKQREWRLETTFDCLLLVRFYSEI
ncbi:uncharacterized protein [Coffea arabica]|uniref:Ribosome maturation factor RimP N-terminal domain-containing protein n=1 Tax=Coffea arabica TaxID=13443 RepID=A0A6P6UK27_COFAR|nr:uncharacterized protein LOC113711681 [Coffea arabica]